MDLGSLPELAAHFNAAVSHIPALAHIITDNAVNIWTAITQPDAMSAGQKAFQLLKFAGSTVGLCFSLAADSYTGAMGCALADGEALMELSRAGAKFREEHPDGP